MLYEAKSKVSRESVRMAIGQLFDYQFRYETKKPNLSILLPRKPEVDLLNLSKSLGIKVTYKSGDSWNVS